MRNPSLPLLLFLAGLAVAPFLPILGAGLVWDDTVVWTTQLPQFQSLRDVLLPPVGLPEMPGYYYRPLVWLSYLVERALGGGPALLHATNLALHAAATCLVFLLCRAFLSGAKRPDLGAAAGAALFALHPAHAESVLLVSGRTDLLAALFLLGAALAAWAGDRRSKRGYDALAGGLFFLALLSKETALAGLALLPLAALAGDETLREHPLPLRPALATALGFATLGYLFLRSLGISDPIPFFAPTADALSQLPSALGFYLRKALFVWPQRHYHLEIPLPGWNLAVLAAAGAAWAALRRHGKSKALAQGAAWLLLPLLPALPLALKGGLAAPVAERYLYLALVGPALWVARWAADADFAALRHRIAAGVLAAAAMAFALSDFAQTRHFTEDVTLWTSELSGADEATRPFVLLNLGAAHAAKGDASSARQNYELVVASGKNPDLSIRALYNLGNLEVAEAQQLEAEGKATPARERVGAALARYQAALDADPGNPALHEGPGIALALLAAIDHRVTGVVNRPVLEQAREHLEIYLRVVPFQPGLAERVRDIDRQLSEAR